jgi:prepilin-type N-terminal cleavage/methylation domain-containing protein
VRSRSDRDEAGFSLLELMVTMLIGSVLMAIGGVAISNWQRTAQQQGSARQVVSQLRKAAERSVSEGRTYCVDFNGSRSYSVWRYSCSASGTAVEGTRTTQSGRVSLAASVTLPSPAPACPASDTCLYFYPRGTAIPATVQVTSSARSKVYTVHVEGLTARVYM